MVSKSRKKITEPENANGNLAGTSVFHTERGSLSYDPSFFYTQIKYLNGNHVEGFDKTLAFPKGDL